MKRNSWEKTLELGAAYTLLGDGTGGGGGFGALYKVGSLVRILLNIFFLFGIKK